MKQFLALSIAALALVAAGCGDDDSGDSSSSGSSSSSSASTSTESSSSAGAAQSGDVKVDIKGFAFNPKDLTVKKGAKITWTNEDTTAHNVVGGDLKSKTLEQGDSYSYTADEAGTIEYVCTFHANMKATLTVTG
jgi:plastocyanin